MDEKRKDRLETASVLNRMLDALKSFSMDRQTPQNDIYSGAGPGPMSMGAGQAPTIYGDNAVPMRPPPLEQQQGMPQPMQGPQGAPNLSALMGGPHQGTPMQGMHRGTQMQGMGRDRAGMERMMQALTNPYQDGQNANIGDDTRARAMAWMRAQQGG